MHKADECVPLADVMALRDLYVAFLARYFATPAACATVATLAR